MATNDVHLNTVVFFNQDTGKANTIHWHTKQVGAVGASVSALGDDVLDWWNTAYTGGVAMKSLYPSTFTIVRYEFQKIWPLPVGAAEVYDTGFGGAGTSVSDHYEPGAAIVISKRTSLAGRRNRGRLYLPAFTEGNIQNGELTGAVTLTVAKQFAGLTDAIEAEAGTETLGVWSARGSTFNEVTTVKVDLRIRSQRKRQQRAPVYQSSAA